MANIGPSRPGPLDSIQHHHYGDPDWTVSVRPAGPDHLWTSMHAHALFGPDRPAHLWADSHGDHIGLFARLHQTLDTAGQLPTEHTRFTTGDVQRILDHTGDDQ